ncbi:sensor histidine kinase [Nocardia sp. NPDC052566]|uniref:sensor histidine kinase n=1 Tax=Nocardia sp. NPDC052566 TaxID=3364330 RepID=UPI0037CC3F3C
MHLKRFRLRLTLLVGLTSLLLVGAVAVYLAGVLTERTENDEHAAAAERAAVAAGWQHLDTAPDWLRANAWVFDADGSIEPLGETDIAPPLDVADEALADPDGEAAIREVWTAYMHYLEVARMRADGRGVVIAWGLDDVDEQVDRQRLVVYAIAAGVVALLTLATWLLAGRMLAPARRAQQSQRDFLADAAHELRTPVAVIRATASQALSRPRESEEYVRALSEIRDATERAGEGVVQLLDLARLEAGTVDLSKVPLRVDLLAEEIVATAAAGGAAVELTTASAAVVDGDDVLLRQAIDNVVRNALSRAEHVWVEVERRDKRVVVTVTDDGPGFDPAVLPHVFRRFARGHGQGHGLGLALVRSIVALHGGETSAANRTEGGALVRLSLPLSATGSG